MDIIIVGGGIHGAGIAQAAAAAGYRTLLLERRSLASGTSSRSSKLIHGGLRYLETGQLRLVLECLQERRVLRNIAPHHVRLIPFYIPIYRDSPRGRFKIRTGLSMYSTLAALAERSTKNMLFRSVPKREWDRLDGLKKEGLKAVYEYYDGQADDKMLTTAVADSARRLGAEIIQHSKFESAKPMKEGYEVSFTAEGIMQKIPCKILINAAGPWANQVLESSSAPKIAIKLVVGSHIEVDYKLKRGGYYIQGLDKRPMFVLPWNQNTLIGTTERLVVCDPDAIMPTKDELRYLVESALEYFPINQTKMIDFWAGARVMMQGDDSRDTIINVYKGRLITICGGKLTCYRLTSQRIIEKVAQILPPKRAADTAQIRL